MSTRDEVLNVVIPHRLNAIATLNLLANLRIGWGAPKPMEMYFDGRLQITGNSNAFANPVIEAGLIHCRALLEFVGLSASASGPTKLTQRTSKRRSDDWGIEHFSNSHGALPMVTPTQALSKYTGDVAEAENALTSVLRVANKALAHITSRGGGAVDIHLLEIASRGVPAIVISYFYKPLGVQPPAPSITARTRNAA